MDKPKYTAKVDNIYFLARVGETLRWATQDIADEELPADIKHLLAKLDRLEARAEAKRQRPISTNRAHNGTPDHPPSPNSDAQPEPAARVDVERQQPIQPLDKRVHHFDPLRSARR